MRVDSSPLWRHAAVAAVLALCALAGGAAAQQPGWIADQRTGCKVWNQTPGPDESVTWSGACASGLAQGTGKMQWFVAGQANDTYVGEVRDGRITGRGVYTWANGDRYEGDYRDNKRNGRGVVTLVDGERYDGQWRDDKRNGRGVAIAPDGERYDGEWLNDKRHGRGVATKPNGYRYDGEWRDDKQAPSNSTAQADDGALDACTKGKPQAALPACNQLLASGKLTDRQRALVLNGRGVAYRDSFDHPRALADFDQAIALLPGHAPIYHNRGTTRFFQGQSDRAIVDFDKVLQLEPNNSEAYISRGLSHMQARRFDRAIADLSKAIALAPTVPGAYLHRASAYRYVQKHDLALADFDKTLSLDPEFAFAYTQRGYFFQHQKQYDRALADYTKAVELAPRSAETWNALCWLRAITGNAQRALADCDRSLALRPARETFDSRGFVYLKLGRYAQSIADYDAALQLDPTAASSLYGRGLAKLRGGDTAGGTIDLASARNLDPGITAYYAELGFKP